MLNDRGSPDIQTDAQFCIGYHNLTTLGHEAGQIINLDTFTVCGINSFFNSEYSWITGY